MVNAISLPASELVSLALVTFLNGVFYTLFFITIITTFYVKESSRHHHIRMLPVSFLMLVVSTMHLFVLWGRGMEAFIVQKGGSALAFYDDLSDWTSVARVTCLVIQSVLGDLVIIWRLYVVYGQRFWIVVPPLLLVTCYTMVGSVAISYIQKARPGSDLDIFNVAKAWITAYFSMTMSSNIICSGAISTRIYLAWKSQSRGNARLYRRIVFAIVESSALYALGVLAALVSFVSGTNGQYAAVDAIIPLVGIVFCLIAIQIHVHVNSTSNINVYSRGPTISGSSGARSRGNNNTTGCDSEFAANKQTRGIPMTIHVTNQTHVLNCLESGDSAPYSLSDIDKEPPAAA